MPPHDRALFTIMLKGPDVQRFLEHAVNAVAAKILMCSGCGAAAPVAKLHTAQCFAGPVPLRCSMMPPGRPAHDQSGSCGPKSHKP